MTRLALFALAIVLQTLAGTASDLPPLILEVSDYLALPITGKLDGKGQTDGMLARVNSFREEPGGGGRVFVHDLTGPLYLLDKQSKTLTTYLNFNGRDGKPGIFHKLVWEAGWANGLITFQFDPEYLSNGRFYTVHLEDPATAAAAIPDNTSGWVRPPGYTVTAPVVTPGPITREGVLIEGLTLPNVIPSGHGPTARACN